MSATARAVSTEARCVAAPFCRIGFDFAFATRYTLGYGVRMRLSFLMGDIGGWTPAHAGALAAPYPATTAPEVTAEQITIVGLVVSVITAGAAGQWVFGWVYKAMVDERDFWRDRALGSTGLAEIATDEAEKRAKR